MYDNKIVVLRGADRVRKRPAVVFDADDCSGAFKAFEMLLDFLSTEGLSGNTKHISVTVFEDNSICLYSADRGMIIDETIIDNKPAWFYDFCELYAGEKFKIDALKNDSGKKHKDFYGESEKTLPKYYNDGDLGFSLCCVQYCTEFMEVYSVRDGEKKSLYFEKGNVCGDLKREASIETSGTCFKFKLDSEVFSDINIPSEWLLDLLEEKAVTVPGVTFELKDLRNKCSKSFYYENGVLDYVKSASDVNIPLFDKSLEATGKDRYDRPEYNAKVRVILGFTNHPPKVKCFHNHRELKMGGTHLEKVKENIAYEISRFLNNKPIDEIVPFEEISKNLVLAIETYSSSSSFKNALKNSLDSTMITDMAHDLVWDNLYSYLKENCDKILAVVER